MIWKIIYSLMAAIICLFMFVSCNQDEMSDMEVPATDSPQEIRFEMAYATPAVAPDNDTPGTRVATNGNYTNSWEDGDEVGVFIVKGNASLQSSGNWVNNMKMTFNDGSWSYTLPLGKKCYPVDETLSFYAYYPYSDAFNPTSQTLTLPTDQSVQTDLADQYLFTAQKTGIQASLKPVQLQFSSALAMIELSLESGGDGGRLTDRIVVTMEGCKTDLVLNLESGKTEATGKASPITLRRVEQPDDADYRTNYTYQAIVPAQTLPAQNELFHFTYKDVNTDSKLSYRPNEAITLEQGWVKPFEITLKPVINPTHQYEVGDIYPHKGLPMGVVYEVDETGEHGKIISYEYTYTSWGKGVGIPENEDSGIANMKAVYEVNGNSFDGYPAFLWADNLNPTDTEYTDNAKGIWYLPAYNELIALCNQWDNLADSFEKFTLLDREGYNFGSSSSASEISYSFILWSPNDLGQSKGIGHKEELPSYFFAIMEF